MTSAMDEKRMREIAAEECAAWASADKIRAIAQEETRTDTEMRELAEEVYSEHVGFPGPGLVRQIVAEELAKLPVTVNWELNREQLSQALEELLRERVKLKALR